MNPNCEQQVTCMPVHYYGAEVSKLMRYALLQLYYLDALCYGASAATSTSFIIYDRQTQSTLSTDIQAGYVTHLNTTT